MFFSNNKSKGQGALEYLLIIGGALVVAITVIVLVISMSGSNKDAAVSQSDALTKVIDNSIATPIISRVDCNSTALRFTINSPETSFRRIANGGAAVDFTSATAVGGVYTITGLTVQADGRHHLTVAAVKDGKMSPFSSPELTCKP